MGRTNIHSAGSLFKRSGTSFEEIAYIVDAQKLVYIVNTPLDQTDLDRYAELLRANILGSWVRKDSSPEYAYSQPDLQHSIPKVVVSSGMKALRSEIRSYSGVLESEDEESEELDLGQKELVYILITEGRSGAVLSKTVIEPTQERAAAHAMHEALNGFSIVFTAAILKVNVGKLGLNSYSFKAVENRRALERIDEDPTTKYIGFWC
jgi:hypothetical protein